MSYSPDYLGERKTGVHLNRRRLLRSTHYEHLKDWMIDLQYQRRHFVPWEGQPSDASSWHTKASTIIIPKLALWVGVESR